MGHVTGCRPRPQELRHPGVTGPSGHLPKSGAGLHPKEALCGRWPIQDKPRLCSKPAAKGEKLAGPGQEAKGLPYGPPDPGPVL